MENLVACKDTTLLYYKIDPQYRDKNQRELFDILLQKEDAEDLINPMDLFADEYGERFALFQITEKQSSGHENCIGYSYGSRYNRSGPNDLISPKTLFVELEGHLFECNIYGRNLVLSITTEKDLGRDAYYPNSYKYISSTTGYKILLNLLETEEYSLVLGDNFRFNPNYDAKNIVNLKHLYNRFSKTTRYHNHYPYFPIKAISLSDLDNLNEIIQLIEARSKMYDDMNEIDEVDRIKKIRSNGIYQGP